MRKTSKKTHDRYKTCKIYGNTAVHIGSGKVINSILRPAKGKNPIYIIAGSVAGFLLGILFNAISGDLDAASYLLELMSMVFVEPLFVVFFAVFARKYDWIYSTGFALLGFAGSMLPDYTLKSITPVIFLKDAFTGIILGKREWLSLRFTLRFAAVSLPGLILSVFIGYQLVLHGVSPEILDGIKQESLDLYNKFMSKDDALNAAENALIFLKSIFSLGFALTFLFNMNLIWFSFLFSGFILPKFRETVEEIPKFTDFKLPFHAVWLFIISAGLWLTGFQPLMPFATNLLAATAGLYAIQGLAVVLHNFNRISMGRLPRIAFWVIFFLTLGFTAAVMVFVGLLDNWFSLRIVNNDKMSNEG